MKKLSIPIVTDVPPDPGYTAGQVLHRIIASIPEAQFELFWLNQSGLPSQFTIPGNCTITRVFGFQLHGIWLSLARLTKKIGSHAAILHRLGVALRLLMWIAKTSLIGLRLGLSLRRSESKVVWCVVQGEKTVLCYLIVSFVSGKRIIIHQWDPLSWWMTHRGHPRKVYALVRRLLDRLERKAILNLVPSDVWKARMESEGKTCLRIDNFFDDPLEGKPYPVLLSDPSALHVVFVGQFYSNSELEALLAALVRALLKEEKGLVVHCFGFSAPPIATGGYRVIAHGALPRDELVTRISKWDLALLPYPTDDRFVETSNQSFPSKSRVYLAAGLPILAWCRDGASPDRFFGKHFGAYYFNARGNEQLDEFVRSILNATPALRRKRFSQAQAVLAQQFSYSSELVPFRDFLVDHA